jgi:peptide/nickel transport system permease protein
MGLLVIGRLATVVPVLFGVSVVIFLLMHLAPGDVTQVLLGPMASEAAKQELRTALGLDQPLPVQYLRWLGHMVQGDFGTSIANKRAVVDVVFPKLLNTAILGVAAALLACTIGFLVGVFTAARAQTPSDWVTMGVTLVVGSTPPFWLGLLLVFLFSLTWRWFPATGMQSITGDGGVLDVLRHLVLPAVATAAYPAAIVTRMVRASMREILDQTYIKVARAKGIPRRLILRKHAMRNALPPIATICGLQLGYLLSGALFTEVVFAWPGLGNQLYYAIIARDIPTVQAAVLLIALIFVLVNLAVDLLNAYLDPRIRAAAGGAPS